MARLTRLTKPLHDKLVEVISTGCTLKVACALVKVNYSTLARWVMEGKDPANVAQRKLREDIQYARAFAETEALKNIQSAGLDPDNWRANCWFLTNSIRGRYLQSAVATRPMTNISLAEISRDMDHDHDQDQGNGQYVPQAVADRMEGDVDISGSQE